MNWATIKVGVIILFTLVISEGIRLYTVLPITIIDIGIIPITCLLIYYTKFYTFPFSKKYYDKNTQPPLNSWQLIGFLLFTIMLAIIGIWLTWIGVHNPLHYFYSVKGSAHGYTLIQLGLVTTLYSIGGGLIFLHRLIRLHYKSV